MKTPLFVTLLLISLWSLAQEKKYKVGIVAFYNLENFFDTINDPKKKDDDFTPAGSNNYTGEVYEAKVKNLTAVISEIGTDISPDGFSLLGVAEVENDKVIQDLIAQPDLLSRHLKFVHFDGPDARGIDPALIYNPKYFIVKHSEPLLVPLVNSDNIPYYTRDMLWVTGLYNGEMIHVFVCHWPSRLDGDYGGVTARAAVAAMSKRLIDSLMKINPQTKVILMGDLNDEPLSLNLSKVLGAKSDFTKLKDGELFNPWVDFFNSGIGTVYNNEAWSMYDQILFSSAFMNKEQKGFYFHAAHIFNREYMITRSGKYKGYPFRTYDGNIYVGGYSDHLPPYCILLKETE